MDRFEKGLLIVGLAMMAYGVWGIYQAELVTDYLFLLVFRFDIWGHMPDTTSITWFKLTLVDWVVAIIGFYAVLLANSDSEQETTERRVSTRRVRRRKKR